MPQQPGYFGPLVIGEEQHKSEQAIVENSRHKFGPLVAGEPPEQPVNDAAPELLTSLTVDSLDERLKENPALARRYFSAEEARDEGPRKGALELIIDAARFTGDKVTLGRAEARLDTLNSPSEPAEGDSSSREGEDQAEGAEGPETEAEELPAAFFDSGASRARFKGLGLSPDILSGVTIPDGGLKVSDVEALAEKAQTPDEDESEEE